MSKFVHSINFEAVFDVKRLSLVRHRSSNDTSKISKSTARDSSCVEHDSIATFKTQTFHTTVAVNCRVCWVLQDWQQFWLRFAISQWAGQGICRSIGTLVRWFLSLTLHTSQRIFDPFWMLLILRPSLMFQNTSLKSSFVRMDMSVNKQNNNIRTIVNKKTHQLWLPVGLGIAFCCTHELQLDCPSDGHWDLGGRPW